MKEKLARTELFAYLGEDELGSGEVGLKQGVVAAGTIALVAIRRDKIEKLFDQMERQAQAYGKRIYLCRFELAEVLRETKAGE